jgi:hypothetical protein
MSVLFLDIETAADSNLSSELMESLKSSIKPDGRAKDPSESIQKKMLELVEKAPLNPLMNMVIAIGVLRDDEPEAMVNVQSDILNEKGLLDILSLNIKSSDTIATFNGSSFDLPMLRLAYMRHGLPCHRLFFPGSKYDTTYHVDLRNILTNYDPFGAGTQDQWAMRLGINVPAGGVSGKEVPMIWAEKRYGEVAEKNRRDLIVLREIYRKLHNSFHQF